MSKYGIVIVSHVNELAFGLQKLLSEISCEVEVTYSGGLEDNSIGTDYEAIMEACNENTAEHLLCFYDLGSAKMTLEIVLEDLERKSTLYDTALVEGAFTAATLIQAGVDLEGIEEQLNSLIIK